MYITKIKNGVAVMSSKVNQEYWLLMWFGPNERGEYLVKDATILSKHAEKSAAIGAWAKITE